MPAEVLRELVSLSERQQRSLLQDRPEELLALAKEGELLLERLQEALRTAPADPRERQELKAIASKLSGLNRHNENLVRSGLRYIDFALRSASRSATVYAPSGQKPLSGTAAFIDRRF